MRGATSACLGVALLAIALPAAGDLYRCPDAEGHMRFTNDPSACPGAAQHEPDGRIQRIDGPPASASRTGPTPPAPESYDAAREAAWRGKLRQAEQERDVLRAQSDDLHKLLAWCNRGGSLAEKDESGVRHRVPCREVRTRYQQSESRFRELQAYLQEGIQEECRRAGCLPGWLR